MVGAGGSGEGGGMDAGNILKPALARGELHIVGATTLDEYRQSIEKDAALERRFQPVMVPEPSVAGHDRDPARAARPLRGAPPGAVHRRGPDGGRGALRALRHRPVPARQGHRPRRPGGRPEAAALEGAAHRLPRARAQARVAAAGQGPGRRRRGLRAGGRPARRGGAGDRRLWRRRATSGPPARAACSR